MRQAPAVTMIVKPAGGLNGGSSPIQSCRCGSDAGGPGDQFEGPYGMDLHPAVVGVEYVRSGDGDPRSRRRGGDISARANPVVVASVGGARWPARRASGLIGGDDLGDQ